MVSKNFDRNWDFNQNPRASCTIRVDLPSFDDLFPCFEHLRKGKVAWEGFSSKMYMMTNNSVLLFTWILYLFLNPCRLKKKTLFSQNLGAVSTGIKCYTYKGIMTIFKLRKITAWLNALAACRPTCLVPFYWSQLDPHHLYSTGCVEIL